MPIIELYERAAKPRGFSTVVRDVARLVPGLKWNAELKQYDGYPDAIEAFALRLDAVGVALIERRSLPLSFEFTHEKHLRPYQRIGVEWLIRNAKGGAILSDDVGCGKSAQTIAAMKALGTSRIVIVCPAIVKEVWRREIEKWWPEMVANTYVAYGAGDQRTVEALLAPGEAGPNLNVARIVIFNYEILKHYSPKDQIDLIVFDEGHYLQNYKSQRSIAAKNWATAAVYRILLSATPMSTKPKNLHNLCETISPGRFGPFVKFKPIVSGFGISYCDGHQETIDAQGTTVWNFEGPSADRLKNVHVAKLNAELAMRLKFFMLRRTKAEVMADLPSRTRQVIEVAVPAAAIIPADFTDRDALRRALDISGAAKIPHAGLFAKDLIAGGERVVLFAHLRETVMKLAKVLKCQFITGALKVDERHAIVDAKPELLVATIDSVTTGIDLSHFNSAIMVDLDYVPWKLLQLEGRLHRFGQVSNVNFYYLIGIGTVDERVRDVVLLRLELYEKVLGDSEASVLRTELKGAGLISSEAELLAAMRAAVTDLSESDFEAAYAHSEEESGSRT